MDLMPDEKILQTSDNEEVTLTTHRVRVQTKEWGKALCRSIMLEEICSCEVLYTSSPIYIVISILCLIIGGFIGSSSEGMTSFYVGIVIAVLFIVIYFITRRGTISIASCGKTIKLKTVRMGFDNMVRFIDEVEKAKNQRYLIGR